MTFGGKPRPGGGGTGTPGRGISGLARQAANLLRFTLSDNSIQDIAQPSFRGAWTAATAYLQGDSVTYLGQTYLALADFTSGGSFNAANWSLGAATGAPGSGVLAVGTALAKGNAFYLNASGVWTLLKPGSHELGLGLVGVVDTGGNVIASNNVVDVTGLNYVAGNEYYVEEVDGSGRNYAITTLPLPAGLQPSLSRSYFRIGRAYTLGGKTLLDFKFEASVLDGAVAAVTRSTIWNDLTVGQQATGAQLRRLVDINTSGNSDTSGFSANGLRTEASGDVDAGWLASPVTKVISGTATPVFLQEYGFGGVHASGDALGMQQVEGDYLMVFGLPDANTAAAGLYFSSSSSLLHVIRLYGNSANVNFLVPQKIVINAAGTAPSTSDIVAGTAVANLPVKRYMCLRVNATAAGVVKVKLWAYDTTKTLLNQGQSEPASSTFTFTNPSGAFPLGYSGLLYSQGKQRELMFSSSPSADTPAPWISGVGA